MKDLVSIITPTYNSAQLISETIKSVLNQTYTDWEMIIVDDCSTDDTDDVVRIFLTDERIRYLKNEKNSGAAVSRNYALREAKGKYIAFLDSDDLWETDKLERQLDFMKSNGYAFTYTDYRVIANDELQPYIITGPDVVTKWKLYNYCYLSTLTVMYNRDVAGLIQIVDLKKNNDYAMWLKIIEKTPCYRYPHCLSYYRRRDGSISSGSKLKLIKHHYYLWNKACGFNSFISVLLTVNNLFWGVLKKLFYKKDVMN